ncbi:7138_t:CDS:2 [Gigaspora margarita]|uniref:7138_t:CDS:1 n=1 Tax=Gigaspora margarita TaxID=4874 RepID=A0ABN7V790_GIGMA|nr:7138_t:CDS:2 [Gigaspora margarita]
MSNIDLFEKIEFGQKFEYASFENKEEIGKGRFGVMCKAYLKDIKQVVALKTLYYYDENSLGDLLKKVCISFVTNLIEELSYEYASFENKTEISKGRFGVKYKAYSSDEKQIVALKTLYYYFKNRAIRMSMHLIKDNRETPVEFKNLYEATWKDKLDSRPDIKKICKKLDNIQLDLFSLKIGLTKMVVRLIKGTRETVINKTPIDFKNLYDAAWGGIPDSRPDIKDICKKLNNIRLEQVL